MDIEWFLLSEKKPPKEIGVLITDGELVTVGEYLSATRTNGILSEWFTGHGWEGYEWEWVFDREKITHWAYPPNPPKIDKSE